MANFFSPFNRLYFALVLLFALLVYGVTALLSLPYSVFGAFYSKPLTLAVLCFAVLFCSARAALVMYRHGRNDGSLICAVVGDIRRFVSLNRMLGAAPVLLLTPVFFSLFTSFKNALPQLVPFYLDTTLTHWDRWLHAGKLPWEWLQPVLGFPLLTLLISILYKLWFLLKYGLICWHAFRWEHEAGRNQFLLAVLLCWMLIGAGAATLLSSAGPCYFGAVTAAVDNPYAALMSYLYQANEVYQIPDLYAQEYLWQAYSTRHTVPFSGISAMPSMHVSMALLFLLAGWHGHRFWRWGLSVYLLCILLGSVHLGWHYALDGYLALILTYAIWRLSGVLVGTLPERAPARR